MNSINLTGRITKELELKYTQSGTAVGSTTMAVDREFSKEKETDFIPLVAWGKTAEFIATYVPKGGRMEVSGRLQVRNYEAKDGSKRTAFEVVVEKCKPIDWAEKDGKAKPSDFSDIQQVDESDMPF